MTGIRKFRITGGATKTEKSNLLLASDVRTHIVEMVVAVSKCGLYDGVFFDGWNEWYAIDTRKTIKGVEALLKGIREHVRDDFLILVNTNRYTAPVSSPYVNGLFLESLIRFDRHYGSASGGFRHLQNTLAWAEENL